MFLFGMILSACFFAPMVLLNSLTHWELQVVNLKKKRHWELFVKHRFQSVRICAVSVSDDRRVESDFGQTMTSESHPPAIKGSLKALNIASSLHLLATAETWHHHQPLEVRSESFGGVITAPMWKENSLQWFRTDSVCSQLMFLPHQRGSWVRLSRRVPKGFLLFVKLGSVLSTN